MQQKRRWRTTHACTDATVTESIKFCGKFARLSAEHSLAVEASKIEARLSVIQDELKSQTKRGVVSAADPQAAILGRLLNLKVQSIQDSLILLMAILLEAGSSLGLYVVMNLIQLKRQRPEQYSEHSPEPLNPSFKVVKSPSLKLVHSAQETRKISSDKANIQSFLNLQTDPSKGSAIGATELFRSFDQERAATGQPQISQRRFGEHMARLGYTDKARCKGTGRIQYVGLKWRSDDRELLVA